MREMLKDFVEYIKRQHTTTRTEGGCETCGYGGDTYEEIDVDDLTRNLDRDIDSFINEMNERNRT